MSNELAIIPAAALPAVKAVDARDALIVRMWINGVRSKHSKRNYQADIDRLFAFVGKPLAAIGLDDLQAYAADLENKGLLASARRRYLASVKSLFKFASQAGIGHLQYNVAAAIRLPRAKDTLNERILSEQQVAELIKAARPGRNRLIVEILYLLGLRAEELTTLCWRDVQAHGDSALLTIFGKGEKTRHLRIEPATLKMLSDWRSQSDENERVFQSRQRKSISTQSVWRIVSTAARAAGIKASTHWLRHAHATHAIDHGCDLRTLQQSLGHASSQTTERYVHSRPKQSSGAFIQTLKPEGNA